MNKGVVALVMTAALSTAAMTKTEVAAHTTAVKEWKAKRLQRITAPDGWLTLIDLHWLAPGKTTFGSKKGSGILLPASAPAVAGELEMKGTEVWLHPIAGVTVDGKPAQAMQLVSDAHATDPTIVHIGDVTMQLIERSGKLAMRVKDPNAPTRKNFHGLQYFPIRHDLRVEATFIPYKPEKKIQIVNVLGMLEPMVSPGTLEFTLNGKKYRIDPVLEEGETDLFLIFGDKTNGKTTYGAGRYLYAAPPDEHGKTIIDFNKAYNPPCSFTHFATCPLPPVQNKLPIVIEAGEKKYAH